MRLFLMLMILALPGLSTAEAVWGSFDSSRINYASGTLTGSAHATLRGVIEAAGGTIAPPTSQLTPAYLSGIDVFYTSLLSTSTGALSAAEQSALHDWISSGGVLIVTSDILSLPAYESFTAYYGVTGYTALSHVGTGYPVVTHEITEGVSSYFFNTESTFSYGSDALLLGNNGFGNAFIVVLEPETGFSAGGRILVFGDHNMFTESFINSNDNLVLAGNFAAWACTPPAALERDTWGGLKGSF